MVRPFVSDFSSGLADAARSPTAADGRARPVASRARRGDPGQVRYLGHWPDLLADLALLGRVWIETEQPGVRSAQRRPLNGLRVHGVLGYLDTPGYQVRLLLDQCHALYGVNDEQGLTIEDRSEQPLVSVQLEAGAHPLPLRLLLCSLGAYGQRVTPAPHRYEGPRIAALEHHAIHRLQRDCQALEPEPGCPGLGFRDVAELSGRLSLNPRPARPVAAHADDDGDGDEGAIAVDPALVPCVLETLVDQVHPLVLISGSGGWVSRSIQQFYAHAYLDGQLSLRGDEARLELDVRAIDSAWVVGGHAGEHDGRSLRLYDEDGRAMAVIASAAAPGDCAGGMDTGPAASPRFSPQGRLQQDGYQGRHRFCRDEARLWTTLMNALTS